MCHEAGLYAKRKMQGEKSCLFFFFGRRLGRLLAELCQAVLEDDLK